MTLVTDPFEFSKTTRLFLSHARPDCTMPVKLIANRGTYQALNKENEELKSELERVTAEAEQLKSEVERLTKALGVKTTQADALQLDVERLNNDNTHLRMQLYGGRRGSNSDKPITEEDEARAEVKRDAVEGDATFYFADAKFLRELGADTATSLPAFHVLQSKSGALVRKTLSRDGSYRAAYADGTYLAVSHRWEAAEEPDPSGQQLRALQAHLHAHPAISFVWCDYCCLPQETKDAETGELLRKLSKAERTRHKWMVQNVSLLFLGCQCLLLVDHDYPTRFWTQYESWLSTHSGSSTGVVAAEEGGPRQRWAIEWLEGAGGSAELREAVAQQLIHKAGLSRTLADVRKALAPPSVPVSNPTDKKVQLSVLSGIQDEVKTAYNADALTMLRAQGMSAASLCELGFSLATFRIAGDAAGVLHAVAGDVLRKLGFADAEAALVCTALEAPRKGLTAEDGAALGALVECSDVLAEINLRGNAVGADGGRILARAIQGNAGALVKLNLAVNQLGPEGGVAIGEALAAEVCGLTELVLMGNNIGPKGAAAIGAALAINSVLAKLNLSDNQLGPDGATSLADGLKGSTNSALTWLDVRYNALTEPAKDVLRDAVKNMEGVKTFNLQV